MEKKILVVDDTAEVRKTLTAAFEKKGYTVVTADSVQNALEVQSAEHCLVMFLDLNLPPGNGLDLCRQIKAEFPLAICYAITGFSSLFQLADCREAGFDDCFPKPVDLPTIYKAAQDAFEKLERWLKK